MAMTFASATAIPVLEIGGTHVTSAWASSAGHCDIVGRVALDNSLPADDLIEVVAGAGRALGAPADTAWGVAIPGPFDYDAGIGDFTGVNKFQAWHGFDVGAALARALDGRAVYFINDADAFGVGEMMAGRTSQYHRSLALTIGTGIGSAFVVDGVPVITGPGVPRLGEVHTLRHAGVPLEEKVSRAAIREAWREVSGEWVEVLPIAQAARAGDARAQRVFDQAYRVLAEVVGPMAIEFGAEAIVLGGSIARSADLVEAYFTPRLATAGPGGTPMPVFFSPDPERSAIVGVAHWVQVRQEGGAYAT